MDSMDLVNFKWYELNQDKMKYLMVGFSKIIIEISFEIT